MRLASVCAHKCVRARALRAVKDGGDLGKTGSEAQSSLAHLGEQKCKDLDSSCDESNAIFFLLINER